MIKISFKSLFYILAVISSLRINSAAQAETLTYVDLVNRLVDLERLAVLPVPGEYAAQSSSYDRKSHYDTEKNQYVDWDANGDGTVNIFDINLISSNWGAMGAATAVPEPSSWVLLSLAAMIGLWRRPRCGRISSQT